MIYNQVIWIHLTSYYRYGKATRTLLHYFRFIKSSLHILYVDCCFLQIQIVLKVISVHLSLWQEDINTVKSWFSSPVYRRYWEHYQQAMAWHQRHRRAYQKALESAYGPGYYQQQSPSGQGRYADWQAGNSPEEEDEEVDDESGSDSEIECDVSNMEISEELRQYFAQTDKHRQELSKKPCSNTSNIIQKWCTNIPHCHSQCRLYTV